MIGLEIFKEHFALHESQYVLIGGAACTLLMEEAGLEFRATKDLDIVLCIEAINAQFVTALMQFIKLGGYKNRQRSSGREIFYRFDTPSKPLFPAMLEIFSRNTVEESLKLKGHIKRIHMNDTDLNLSAILLDDDYYHFIHAGKITIQNLSMVDAGHLIPLKARAWKDLNEKQKQGNHFDSKDIRKHRNDAIRLYRLLSSDMRISLPLPIKRDMQHFIEDLDQDASFDIKQFGLKNTKMKDLTTNFKTIYGLT